MDIFGDKKYEELDWLTKTVEPITYSVNDILSSMPEELVFNIEDLRTIIGAYDLSINGSSAFGHMLSKCDIKVTPEDREELKVCYKLVADNEQVLINFETGEITGGQIKMRKIKECWDEAELKAKMGIKGYYTLVNQVDHSKVSLERLNEILDLMGDNIGTRKRTVKSKMADLTDTYRAIMQDNKWNIRNVDLSNKVALWIQQYIEDGNLAAMTNFCKLKAVTHRGYPIYSIDEEL